PVVGQRPGEQRRGPHRADGVRAGRPDPDLEQVEDADRHYGAFVTAVPSSFGAPESGRTRWPAGSYGARSPAAAQTSWPPTLTWYSPVRANAAVTGVPAGS